VLPWVHITSSYRGHWLPGDGRGFRSRQHRIHSEYFYKDTVPTEQHKGLREYAQRISKDKVLLTKSHRRTMLAAMVEKLAEMELPAAIIALAPTHCHALVKVGDADAKPLFGRAKQAGSHAIRHQVPGRVWGQSGDVDRVRGFTHLASAFWYIKDHETQGAVLWWNPKIEQECEKHHPAARQAERLARIAPLMGWVLDK
jgi:hypothetical protein